MVVWGRGGRSEDLVRGSSMFWGVRQAEKGEVATMSI